MGWPPGGGGRGKELGPWTVLVNQQEVADPSLVLVRIRNTGLTAVAAAGIRRPVTLTFPSRDVIEYAVTDCRGSTGT